MKNYLKYQNLYIEHQTNKLMKKSVKLAPENLLTRSLPVVKKKKDLNQLLANWSKPIHVSTNERGEIIFDAEDTNENDLDEQSHLTTSPRDVTLEENLKNL
jgi:hypothetical protein